MVKPGKDFPIKQDGKKVAALVVDLSTPDTTISVEFWEPGEVFVTIGDDSAPIREDVVIVAQSFKIHSEKKDSAIAVQYIKAVVPPAIPVSIPA